MPEAGAAPHLVPMSPTKLRSWTGQTRPLVPIHLAMRTTRRPGLCLPSLFILEPSLLLFSDLFLEPGFMHPLVPRSWFLETLWSRSILILWLELVDFGSSNFWGLGHTR